MWGSNVTSLTGLEHVAERFEPHAVLASRDVEVVVREASAAQASEGVFRLVPFWMEFECDIEPHVSFLAEGVRVQLATSGPSRQAAGRRGRQDRTWRSDPLRAQC